MSHDLDPIDLLQRARPRPDVPVADVEHIKSAAREVFRARYGRRRTSRWLLPVAAMLIVAVGVGWWLARPEGVSAPPLLVAGDVRLAGGARLWIEEGSRAVLEFPNVVRLEYGTVLVSTDGGATVTIRTAAGDFRPVGTRFEVRVAEETSLRVIEGRVAFGAQTIGANESLVVRGGREVVRLATAMPAIEGRTLLSFLETLARDQGWTLRFATRNAEALCRNAILHGSVEKLTPVEALQTVTLSSGVRYDLAGSILTISEPSK